MDPLDKATRLLRDIHHPGNMEPRLLKATILLLVINTNTSRTHQ